MNNIRAAITGVASRQGMGFVPFSAIFLTDSGEEHWQRETGLQVVPASTV